MTTRSIMKMTALSALFAASAVFATAQAADKTGWIVIAQSASDSTGGSAGDGDRPQTFPNKNFSDLDKNKDGLIDKREQVSTVDANLLKQMDSNVDGYISQTEWDNFTATKKTAPLSNGNQVTP